MTKMKAQASIKNQTAQKPTEVESLPFERGVFCNRTLNMRSIRAIGYDMDYTLIHYRVEEWELRAYEYLKQYFVLQGWPVQDFKFDPSMVCRGLIIDTLNGNLLKANRFGFVKHAMHGTRSMDFDLQRQTYSRIIIDLAERRWLFLNTLFSLSEGCMYAQLVDLLDQRKIPQVLGYADLYEHVRRVLEAAHMEGLLKAEIIADPDRYVILEPEVPLTLMDQFHSGKKLMLITNSEWHYTVSMMTYSFDRFLPKGMTWRDVFDLIVVSARKPQFFTTQQPFFEIVTESGFLKPVSGNLQRGVAYWGGSAQQVEKSIGVSGDEILYVGDHMFGDVHVTKNILRWRTALILRELEQELISLRSFHSSELLLAELMKKKEGLEFEVCQWRVLLERKKQNYGPPVAQSTEELEKYLSQLKADLELVDQSISPLARSAAKLNNQSWGLLMRAGNDKSYLAYQMERYADIYTSRVSNLLRLTPYAYLRSPRGSLPHDRSELGDPR